jgi:beta propeller repeat protein/cysteine-rich repeat protein
MVWQDIRDGNWDIYMYDLGPDGIFNTSDDGGESSVTTHGTFQQYPAVSGNIIVWADSRNGNQDIYMYGLTEAGSCTYPPASSGGACDDGLYCNVGETCDGLGTCTGGSARDCSEGVACTDDSCDENIDQCVNAPNNNNCDSFGTCDYTTGDVWTGTCDLNLGCTQQAAPTENCVNGLDDDCDQLTDCSDPDCEGDPACCGDGVLRFPEHCDDGNNVPGDGCSATCTSEEGDLEFSDTIIADNGDGTYDYTFIRNGIPVITIEGNGGLIDLSDLAFEHYKDATRSGLSLANISMTGTTKTITIESLPQLCVVDDETLISGTQMGGWDCWNEPARITWATKDGNRCGSPGTPVGGRDASGTLTLYSCEEVDINGTLYAQIPRLVHTSVLALEDADEDGVADEEDKCLGTVAWYSTEGLRPNHYDSSNMDYAAAYGCGCDQILFCKPGANSGEHKFGCTDGTMDVWLTQEGWSPDCQVNNVVAMEGEPKDLFENTDNTDNIDIIDGDNDNDGIIDSEDSEPESAPIEPGKQGTGKPDWWCEAHPAKCLSTEYNRTRFILVVIAKRNI